MPISPSRPASARPRPGRCPGRRSTTSCCGTRRRAAPTSASDTACWMWLFDDGRRHRHGAGRRGRRRAPDGARAGDHRRVGPRRAPLAQVRSANRRTAPRQPRGVLALLRRPAGGRTPRRRHPHHRARGPRVVLDDSDFRRADERRRRAAAVGRAGAAGAGARARCSTRTIAETPVVARLLASARREWPVRVEKDFSFGSRAYAGDRWVLAGDAGSFLDPVFSTGVAIALESGLEAAQAVAEGLAAGDLSARRFRRFARRQRQRYRSFRRFVARVLHAGVPRSVFRRGARPAGCSRALVTVFAGYWRPLAHDAALGRPLLPARSPAAVGAVLCRRSARTAETHESPTLPAETRYWTRPDDRQRIVNGLFDRSAEHYDRACGLMAFGSGQRYRREALGARRAPAGHARPRRRHRDRVARARDRPPPRLVRSRRRSRSVRNMMAAGRRALNLRFVQGLGERLPFPDGQFDFVTMGYALRHVPDLDQAFEEYRRVLKPGRPAAAARNHAAGVGVRPGAGARSTSGRSSRWSRGSAPAARTPPS